MRAAGRSANARARARAPDRRGSRRGDEVVRLAKGNGRFLTSAATKRGAIAFGPQADVMHDMSTTASAETVRAERVLLFDGECGLCQALVRFLLRRDRARRLWFAPLQGATAQAYLRERGLPTVDFQTAVYVPAWRERPQDFLVRNDAVLAVLAELGGAWRAVRLLRVLPRSWRDAAYRLVARLRYRLFGAYRPRELPAAWRERILA